MYNIDVYKSEKNTNITLYFDIHLNGVNNIYEAATITQQVAANKTIVLCNDLDIPVIEPLIKLNYIGYILKTAEPYQLNYAIKKYRNDEPHIDHEIDNYYKDKGAISKEIQGPSGKVTLTDKELEIILLLAQDFTPKIICKKLIMKMNTYKTHRTHICEKIHTAGFRNMDSFITHLRNIGWSF